MNGNRRSFPGRGPFRRQRPIGMAPARFRFYQSKSSCCGEARVAIVAAVPGEISRAPSGGYNSQPSMAFHRRFFWSRANCAQTGRPERLGADARGATVGRCRQRPRYAVCRSACAGTDQRDRRDALAVDGHPPRLVTPNDLARSRMIFGTMVGCTRCFDAFSAVRPPRPPPSSFDAINQPKPSFLFGGPRNSSPGAIEEMPFDIGPPLCLREPLCRNGEASQELASFCCGLSWAVDVERRIGLGHRPRALRILSGPFRRTTILPVSIRVQDVITGAVEGCRRRQI